MQGFLTTLLVCSISMSVISLIYMAAMPHLAKRYTAKWRYYIWLVLVLGWLIPFRPDFGLAWLMVNRSIPTAATMEPVLIIAREAQLQTTISLWWIVVGVWLVGAVGLICYLIWQHRQFRKLVHRWGEKVTDRKVLEIWATLKQQMRIKTPVDLKICPLITSPMLVGLWRPVVLLPCISFHAEQLQFILKHELVHLKQKHLWHKWLVLLATVVHWFNPVVYLMAKAVSLQGELCCDELVLKGSSWQERQQYGITIIDVAQRGLSPAVALSTSFYGRGKNMKLRLVSVMDTTNKRIGIVIFGVAMIAILGAGIVFASILPKEIAVSTKNTAADSGASGQFISKEIYNLGNYAEFLTVVENDPAKYYYNSCWVRSLYDENNQKTKPVLYFNCMEDKDVVGKKAIHLRAIRNIATNEIEKLVEMPEDEVFQILVSNNDNLIQMARTPYGDG